MKNNKSGSQVNDRKYYYLFNGRGGKFLKMYTDEEVVAAQNQYGANNIVPMELPRPKEEDKKRKRYNTNKRGGYKRKTNVQTS